MAARCYWFLWKLAWSWALLAFAAEADGAGAQGFMAIEPPPFSAAAWSCRAALAFEQSCALGADAAGEGDVAVGAACWARAATLVRAARRLTEMRREAFTM